METHQRTLVTHEPTSLESGGFGSWQRITTLADGIGQALGTPLMIGAVYDREYFCPEEIAADTETLSRHLRLAHVHQRKEIENYILVPDALDRAIARAVADRASRTGIASGDVPKAAGLLQEITDPLRDEVQSQFIARRTTYLRSSGRDVADLTRETLAWFTPQWGDLSLRLQIVPGKEVLRVLREKVQALFNVSISDARIVDALHRHEIAPNLEELIRGIERFRTSQA